MPCDFYLLLFNYKYIFGINYISFLPHHHQPPTRTLLPRIICKLSTYCVRRQFSLASCCIYFVSAFISRGKRTRPAKADKHEHIHTHIQPSCRPIHHHHSTQIINEWPQSKAITNQSACVWVCVCFLPSFPFRRLLSSNLHTRHILTLLFHTHVISHLVQQAFMQNDQKCVCQCSLVPVCIYYCRYYRVLRMCKWMSKPHLSCYPNTN